MKIAFAWKWWAGKTTLSSLIIRELSRQYKILALDLDSNVNLANSLWMDSTFLNYLGPQKDKIMSYTKSTSMTDWENRIYLPKKHDWFYNYDHEFIDKNSIKKWNISLLSLWFIEDDNRWIESMCDYYEMSKVFMNHINLENNEILVWDLAAWVEMISRATVMSFDLIFIVTDINFKNIKVSKQIINWLEKIWFNKDEFCIILNKYLDESDFEDASKIFSGYDIVAWIPYLDEIYDLDLWTEWDYSIDKNTKKSIDKICKKIVDFKSSDLKTQEEIYRRISALDKIKEDFLN